MRKCSTSFVNETFMNELSIHALWRCVVLLGVCRHADYGKSSTKGI